MKKSIYELTELEELINNKLIAERLKNRNAENIRFIVPGYKYNYYLDTFQCDFDFYRRKDLDDNDISVDIQFSANQCLDIKVVNIVDNTSSTHIYDAVILPTTEIVRFRIVCPDVLSDVYVGDVIKSQVVFFADYETFKWNNEPQKERIFTDEDGDTTVIGTVDLVSYRSFEFEGINKTFAKIIAKTEAGDITLLIPDKIGDIECGKQFSTKCLASADVSMELKKRNEGPVYNNFYEPFYKELYGNVRAEIEDKGTRNGLIPNYRNDRRVMIKCFKDNDFLRFIRCCEKTVRLTLPGEGTIEIPREKLTNITNGKQISNVETKHFLSCEDEHFIGHEGIIVSFDDYTQLIYSINIDNLGLVESIKVFTPDMSKMGLDYELNLLSGLSEAMCCKKPYLLSELLSEKCVYRSEYADRMMIGSKYIIARFEDINTRIDETNSYTFKIVPSSEVLRSDNDLPEIYSGKWAAVTYQADELAYVAFLVVDNNKIAKFLLSRNKEMLNVFENETETLQITRELDYSLKEYLEKLYCIDNPVVALQNKVISERDFDILFLWKNAEDYAKRMMSDKKMIYDKKEIFDDCIGFTADSYGEKYAIFFYAFDSDKKMYVNPDYCQRLLNLEMSKDRIVLVCCLCVEKKEDGKYRTGYIFNSNNQAEFWMLGQIQNRPAFIYYPTKKIYDMNYRFMAAYNNQNIDLLKVLISKDVGMTSEYGGSWRNCAVWGHIADMYAQYGPMKLAYVRYNAMVYNIMPFIEDYCFIGFDISSEFDTIAYININSLGTEYRELVITDEVINEYPSDIIPRIVNVEFLEPEDVARFSLKADFENGEQRYYICHCEGESEEVENIDGIAFTDKIFNHGRIVDHINYDYEFCNYSRYPVCGQGIEFINGYCISATEVYLNGSITK